MIPNSMSTSNIYHERQTRQLCALHCLNNLFQAENMYTKKQLDQICNDLTPNAWINPHRSILGIGNYDVNVIMTALQSREYEAKWFDKRRDPSCIELESIFGFILNVPSDFKFGIIALPLRRRHWIAVRRIGDQYYNLDSKLEAPECIGHETELLSYLRYQLETMERELFIICRNTGLNDSKSQTYWLKDTPDI